MTGRNSALSRYFVMAVLAAATLACSQDLVGPRLPGQGSGQPPGASLTLAAAGGSIAHVRGTYGSVIYTMEPDGSGVDEVGTNNFPDAPINSFRPQISPDGTKIVFHRPTWYPVVGETNDIYVMNVDGTGVTNLTNSSNYQDAEPTWSPDGSQIAFKSNRDDSSYNIYTMDSDGSDVTKITSTPTGGYESREPSWSPDGTQIAYTTNALEAAWILCIVTIGGGTSCATSPATRFGSDIGGIGGTLTSFFNPDWGPGGRIAVTGHWGECSGCNRFDIFTMDPDFTDLTLLTGTTGSSFHSPSWSPDGTQIAYVMNTGSATTGIGVMDADGTDETLVAAGSFTESHWGPDVSTGPPSSPQCSDGEDNDNDGRIDGRDPGCSGSNDDSESPDPVCHDGIDNDGDGWEDYPADTGCSSPSDGSEEPDAELSCRDQTDRVLTLARRLQPSAARLLVESAVRGALAWERLVPGWGAQILEMNRVFARSSRFSDRTTTRILALLDDMEESCF